MAFLHIKSQARLEPPRSFWLSRTMAQTETNRKKRLAEQLRANLRLRKTQDRELTKQAADPGETPGLSSANPETP